MRVLVMVSCGGQKIWKGRPNAGPTKAKDAYTGPYFRKNREYAEKFADRWVILSAKHGFINPDFVIPEDYNVSFKRIASRPISLNILRGQVTDLELDQFDKAIVLGGKEYVTIVRTVFEGLRPKVSDPLEGLPIGKKMSKVKSAIEAGKPFT